MPALSENSSASAPTSPAAPTPDPGKPEGRTTMQIQLTAGEIILRATLLDNETTRDFISLLPLTFYNDFGYSQGLVKLGHVDSGIDELSEMSDGREITIGAAER
jgi:hypothetical protein